MYYNGVVRTREYLLGWNEKVFEKERVGTPPQRNPREDEPRGSEWKSNRWITSCLTPDFQGSDNLYKGTAAQCILAHSI